MRRAWLLLALLPAPALAGSERPPISYASPGAVVGAEIGFNAAAREEGLLAAYKSTAGEGAWLLEPDLVSVQGWLKNRSEPPPAGSWSPDAVWASCDGTFAVTQGNWRNGAEAGRFVTLWQRQEDGGYKWMLRQQMPLAPADPEPDMIAATVADCPRRKEADAPSRPEPVKQADGAAPAFEPHAGASQDGSLVWSIRRGADGQNRLTVTITKDGAAQTIVGEPAT